MASSLIVPTVVTHADAIRFVQMEEHATYLLLVGGSSDFGIGEEPGVCLGPFLKHKVVGHEVPLNYLLIEQSPAHFCKGFSSAHNWIVGKDIYCFPLTSREIKIEQWYTRLDARLTEKCDRLGIQSLIQLSLSSMEVYPRFCAQLLLCLNSSLN